MNTSSRITHASFYRIKVGLDYSKSCANQRLLKVEFDGSTYRDSEIVRGGRTFFVLCDGEHPPLEENAELSKDEKTFLQIIDPDTLVDLGRSLKCSVVDGKKEVVNDVACIVVECEEIDPPKWIPVPNDRVLIASSYAGADRPCLDVCPFTCTGMFLVRCSPPKRLPVKFSVLIRDRKLGMIPYETKTIEVEGVDVRIYGNKIEYDGKIIKVDPLQSGPKSTYMFSVKGSRLKVKDVRTIDVEEIQIKANEKIEIELHEKKQDNDLVRIGKGSEKIKSQWWGRAVFLVCLCFWAGLSWLPFGCFSNICDKYFNVLNRVPGTNEVVSVGCTYSSPTVTNTLSMQTYYSNTLNQNPPTNVVNAAATSINSTVGSPTAARGVEGQGTFGVTFYLLMSCILYVVFYCAIVYLTFAVFRTLRRSSKLNGNMRSVIDALRNERDKDKRKAMQKKILDDMIDTYLDRPSSDE